MKVSNNSLQLQALPGGCCLSVEFEEGSCGLQHKQRDHQVKGVVLPLCSTLVRPPCSAVSSSGAPDIRRTRTCWSESRGGHEDAQRAGAPLLWRQGERVGVAQPGEGKALGRP